MSFDNAIHAVNQAFETDVRTALDRAEDCPKTEEARAHLRAARRAELGRNEADWMLGIERAARALTEARALSRPQSAQADSYLSNGRS
ncbi:hypothetical protein [Pararhodobacter sp. SW119]|uniref:hypothetical protein n=1 Tax=Pararhodobacter sp. SW119 TaxID=2780075 RepID=UPI001ADFC042|nr:hypothetical protein [Pararhodobacter sp. SW119]